MASVDTVTQRNASSAEELSSTAEELAAQSEALQQLMAFFRVENEKVSISARKRVATEPKPAVLARAPLSPSSQPNGYATDGSFTRF